MPALERWTRSSSDLACCCYFRVRLLPRVLSYRSGSRLESPSAPSFTAIPRRLLTSTCRGNTGWVVFDRASFLELLFASTAPDEATAGPDGCKSLLSAAPAVCALDASNSSNGKPFPDRISPWFNRASSSLCVAAICPTTRHVYAMPTHLFLGARAVAATDTDTTGKCLWSSGRAAPG